MDGEIDTRGSLIRFLPYTSGFEVEALIDRSLRPHWLGNPWAGTGWVRVQADLDSLVYPFLPRYADGGQAVTAVVARSQNP